MTTATKGSHPQTPPTTPPEQPTHIETTKTETQTAIPQKQNTQKPQRDSATTTSKTGKLDLKSKPATSKTTPTGTTTNRNDPYTRTIRMLREGGLIVKSAAAGIGAATTELRRQNQLAIVDLENR